MTTRLPDTLGSDTPILEHLPASRTSTEFLVATQSGSPSQRWLAEPRPAAVQGELG
ncbi:hypothetical protein ACFTZB_18030 [Rhodococcus sp. NPDC057014]|uniref:hypothetical protein n=1 Tax=Rhodococcus sp. NPDC057014 TaxID=3346000 RepID=UPI00362E43AD